MSDVSDLGGEGEVPRRVQQAPRSARRRSSRWRPILLVIGVPVLIVLAAVTLWYELNANALGAEGKQVVITVGRGESVSSVISALTKDHVVASSLAFKFGDLLHGDPTVIPGDYALHENQTFGEVRALLNAGPNVSLVHVRPGLTLHEIGLRVDAATRTERSTFQQLAASGIAHSVYSPAGSNNLEGLLGTGIYQVFPDETRTQVLQKMVAQFDRQAVAAGLTQASASALNLTPYQVIVAASIVEKEGYYPPSNFPPVARVIYNRLANNIQLQMDSTVLYSLGQDGGLVTTQDRKIQSPYNTYLNKGLTPTPVCSPSLLALRAAVHPPPGPWLFFVVVKKDGTEAFSATSAGQLANEQLAKSRGL